jgi:hypothetical protein
MFNQHRAGRRKTSAVAEEQKSAVAEEALAVERKDNKDPAVADASLESSVESMEALKWSTGLTDTGIIHGLLATLPEWSIKQQILAYRARDRVEKKQATEETKIMVFPTNWHSRNRVAQAFDKHIRSCGVTANTRIPRGCLASFVEEKLMWQCKPKRPEKSVRDWRRQMD